MRRAIPITGLGTCIVMLLLELPYRSVSPAGIFWTVLFYLLNPLFFAVQLFAPHGAHELEHSSWPTLAYPVAAITAVAWWGTVYLLLAGRWRRRAT